MTKKPISPNFDLSNRFLTDYILQNFAFTYTMLPHQEPRNLLPGHTLFLLLNIILKSFMKYFVSRGVLNMIEI